MFQITVTKLCVSVGMDEEVGRTVTLKLFDFCRQSGAESHGLSVRYNYIHTVRTNEATGQIHGRLYHQKT